LAQRSDRTPVNVFNCFETYQGRDSRDVKVPYVLQNKEKNLLKTNPT